MILYTKNSNLLGLGDNFLQYFEKRMFEYYNGIELPNGRRFQFQLKPRVEVVKDNCGISKLVASEDIKDKDYIGTYGGKIVYFGSNDAASWNPLQVTPSANKNHYIDAEQMGNELRYMTNPMTVRQNDANAMFYESDEEFHGYSVCVLYAIKKIKKGEEIRIEYGDDFWTMFKQWYENNNPLSCGYCDFRTNTEENLCGHKIGRAHV